MPIITKRKEMPKTVSRPLRSRLRYLAQEELNRLQHFLVEQNWKTVVFAIETCLRREEQFKLRWDQVDLEAGQLTIPLPKARSDSFTHSPWVFPNQKNPLKHRSAQGFVNRIFTPALRLVGIQEVCWHTLRHTAASRRVMAGVDLVAVQKILGHRDIQTTLRYAHLAPGHLREAINRGSLSETVTKTVTESNGHGMSREVGSREALVPVREKKWLGDKDSNLGSQIQKIK